MIRKYRKRPVEIDAIQYRGDMNFNEIRLFVGNNHPLHHMGNQVLGIETLEGVMHANPGDYIIKGVSGEFYPCKPDIFAKTYEAV